MSNSDRLGANFLRGKEAIATPRRNVLSKQLSGDEAFLSGCSYCCSS
ncbi:hypothetical protein H6G96_15205 [Nostoc sp. FACHB-892]|nr:hypothetical protein [Nostoc sp. FACHB-892]MBD2727637.1 hypothetical protein [Nostoc sp. FACHB-892]